MSMTEPIRLNVTWHGYCPSCGCGMAMTGYRADDTPDARAKLGQPVEHPVLCPVCAEADVPLICVGICLDPFAAKEPDAEDDDEDEWDDD